MKYRQLGKSGLKVSEIALGSWLTYGKSVKDRTAEECIDKAYELGINFFDTANAYEKGQAELILGQALKKYERNSYVVASKVYFPMGDGPNNRGLSRKHIMEQCDASLKRLGLEYLDLYQCHRFDTDVPLEETLYALDDLVKQGKVLYTGVSEWTAAQIERAAAINKEFHFHSLVSNQPIYNMLERYIEKEVLPVSERHGIGQVVFSPLAQGVLTGKYKPGTDIPENSRASNNNTNSIINSYLREEVLETVQKLVKVAEGLGISMTQLALAWILRQPGVSSAIIGASRPEQVEENAKAIDVVLTGGILTEIDDILAEIKDFHPAR